MELIVTPLTTSILAKKHDQFFSFFSLIKSLISANSRLTYPFTIETDKVAVPIHDKKKPPQANINELIFPIMIFPEASKLLLVNALETIVSESIGETSSASMVNRKLTSIIANNNEKML